MESNLQILLSLPQLFVRCLQAPTKLADFVSWLVDDIDGCRMKTRDESTKIKILSFIYTNHELFLKTWMERYLVAFVSNEPYPSQACLVLAKMILVKVSRNEAQNSS